MKKKLFVLALVAIFALFAGCGGDGEADLGDNGDQDTTSPPGVDAVTTASVVDNEADFKAAISSQGTWIICTLKDLTFDEDLVLEGNFINGKKDDAGNDIVQRKIGLYTQDENRNVTARFTLTAPKLTINSPEASIQHGTFKGDLYVVEKNFQLVDAVVDGNIYFASEEAKSTFTMDDKSSVTGTQELEQ
ncbi:hypothetical protein [Sinanaerobacter chloroacetimidivorans]|jgi:hypothetical protein|uniref:Lipoprotein n=1 Tax=Sinanaerobacter chloroacetimidivorans TaxID=2818044 RepID=A0A8J7W267_9FIRM|nr:hypothetical protein [Sinanaerobacter chloroacetimidivorans]MBR0599016.1 hypothetical protein [Sinanaerobacter chloroacetimidivorans]